MSEINEIDKLVLVDVPKVIENEQIYVYIPIAVGDKPGLIAIPANSKDFEVVNGNLKLKWDIDKLLATKLDVPDRGKASKVFTVNDQGKVTYVPYSASQIIIGELSIPMRTVDGDLIVRDTPVDKHAAVNKKYVDTRDNELDAAINTKLNKSSTPGIVYANTNDGELSEPTQIPYSSDPNVDGESIVSRTYDGYFDVKDPLQDAHAANKKYADRIFNDGGTIKKDLNVLGDLKVQGNLVYVTGTTEGVEKQFVELNTNKKLAIGQSGLLINKGITEAGDLGTYAIVYDANKDAVVCGLGTTRVDKIDGKDVLVFKFNDGEGLPLTIRDESDKIANGHLLKWDADGNKLIDTGKSINELLTVKEPTGVQTEFVAINKDFDGNIKQMSLRGVFTPLKDYETYLPVLRGLQGQVKGQTPLPADQTDLDLINRGELTEKLSDKLSTSNIGQGLSFSDNKVNANIAKIQDANAIEFTPDENGAVTIPSGDSNRLGLMRLASSNGVHGLQMWGAGAIAIHPAEKINIDQRIAGIGGGNLSPIISSDINYAVKVALTDDKRIGTETSGTNTAFTDTEKDRACEVLGASRKLYKHTISAYDPDEPYALTLTLLSHRSTAYSNAAELVSANLEDWGLILYAYYNGRYSIGNINATVSANVVTLSAYFLWDALTAATNETLRIHSGLTNFSDVVIEI